ncbi:hypothetical protein Hypma_013344 [Hypsizygus marmoreus]|uniref:Uncharacterized protein n=1 Tax=Hypsizygus marmoreus TaxID=39966 RepID=A0A369JCN2_HYPMA|nr:hypothetical protein Hypma_013344 [Hypsizygus marmoreus]
MHKHKPRISRSASSYAIIRRSASGLLSLTEAMILSALKPITGISKKTMPLDLLKSGWVLRKLNLSLFLIPTTIEDEAFPLVLSYAVHDGGF